MLRRDQRKYRRNGGAEAGGVTSSLWQNHPCGPLMHERKIPFQRPGNRRLVTRNEPARTGFSGHSVLAVYFACAGVTASKGSCEPSLVGLSKMVDEVFQYAGRTAIEGCRTTIRMGDYTGQGTAQSYCEAAPPLPPIRLGLPRLRDPLDDLLRFRS